MNAQQARELKTFVRHLVTAGANASLYSLDHPQVARLSAAAHESIHKAFGSDTEISFLLIEDELVVDGVPQGTDMYITRFGREMKSFGIGHVRLFHGITQKEVANVVAALAKKTRSRSNLVTTDNIRFGKLGLAVPGEQDEGGVVDNPAKRKTLSDIYAEGISLFKEVSEGIRNNERHNFSGIVEIAAGFVDICKKMSHPFQALACLRALDEYTFIHSGNVCVLNLAQAMSLGIDGPLLQDIGVAALLHDIGKLYMPLEILNKPGRLDEKEMELVKQHPVKGAVYLLNTPGIPRLAAITAFEHHMRFDGTGYPSVGSEWRQNLCSQMTTISDFFDAARTKRVYKGAMEFEEIAVYLMDLAGKQFNPALTDNFLRLANSLRTSTEKKQPPQDDYDTATRAADSPL